MVVFLWGRNTLPLNWRRCIQRPSVVPFDGLDPYFPQGPKLVMFNPWVRACATGFPALFKKKIPIFSIFFFTSHVQQVTKQISLQCPINLLFSTNQPFHWLSAPSPPFYFHNYIIYFNNGFHLRCFRICLRFLALSLVIYPFAAILFS